MFRTKTQKEYFFTKNGEIIDKIASNILIDLDNVSVGKKDKTTQYQVPYYNELEDSFAGITNEFTTIVPIYIINSVNHETMAEMARKPEKNGNYTIILFKENKKISEIIKKYIA